MNRRIQHALSALLMLSLASPGMGQGNKASAPPAVSVLPPAVGGIRVTNQNAPFFQTSSFGSGGTFATGVAVGPLGLNNGMVVVVANRCAQGFMSCQIGGSVGVGLGGVDLYPSGGIYANAVAIGDVNGDGIPDIVVVNQRELGPPMGFGAVGVLLGNGDGSFQPVVTSGPGSSAVALADLNSDGMLDIVLAGGGVLLGRGDGTFQPVGTLAPDALSSGGVAVADANGDGKGVAVADVNGDGKLDIVAIGGVVVWILLGNGDGTFQPGVAYGSGASTTGVAIADLNGDGIPDLAVSNCGINGDCWNQTGTVGVLLGNGDGTFQAMVTYSSGADATTAIAVSDINLDGKPDLVTVSQCVHYGTCWEPGATGAVSVLLGNGDGTFQAALIYSSGGLGGESITVADMDGDGRPDLIVGNDCQINSECPRGGGVVAVLLNKRRPTTTSLVSSANPARLNWAVTYTATVTSQSGGSVTGAVTFRDGAASIAEVALAGNQAAYSMSYPRPGSHPVTATFSGDADNASSTSEALTEQIQRPFQTETVLTTSGSPSYVGEEVTLTATVPFAYLGPDGEPVTFYNGNKVLDSVLLWGGKAILRTVFFSANTYSITATYAGDALFKPSTGKVKQVVVKGSTTTNLDSFPNPSPYGQPVTLSVRVSCLAPLFPTGKVRFMNGTIGIGTATLSDFGDATLAKPHLPVGTHLITAEYVGDSACVKSTSNVVSQVVE